MANSPRFEAFTLKPLIDSPWQYDFFQAVRLLKKYQHDHTQTNNIRLLNKSSLNFPTGEVTSILYESDFIVTTSILGIIGQSGALPISYSELILKRAEHNDSGIENFLEIFNNRLLQFYYQAWHRGRFYIGFETKQTSEPTIKLLSSLAGHEPSSINSHKFSIDNMIYFTGLFSDQSSSREGLQLIIQNYFNLPNEIFNHTGQWINLNKSEQTALSYEAVNHNKLGYDSVIGSRVWSTQNKFTIVIGPIDYKQYTRLLPNENIFEALKNLIQLYVGIEYQFNIELKIIPNTILGCTLNYKKPSQLGWNSWCGDDNPISTTLPYPQAKFLKQKDPS